MADTQNGAWPFICTREQMDALMALAADIENFMGEVEETITAADLPTDGIPDWDNYTQAVYGLQSLLRCWADYSGYVTVAPTEDEAQS